MTRSPARTLAALVGSVALVACSGGDDRAAPTSPPAPAPTVGAPVPAVTATETVPAPTPSDTTAPSPTATGEAEQTEPGGCPSNGRPAPAQAGGELIGDFDGEGGADRVVLDGGVLTFATASGLVTAVDLGIPPNRQALAVADPQQDGQTFVFLAAYPREPVGEGPVRITLATLVDCEPVLVADADGETYVIEYRSEGEDAGLGFGCSDADGDGRRDLVGLVQGVSADGDIGFERTVIELDGAIATSGATDTGEIPQDQPAPLASCGDEVFELG